MVADSITDSQLFHASPISQDFFKKRKTNSFWKLKQLKIDARRKQWIYQWKRAKLSGVENGSRLRSLRGSDKFSYLQACRIDDETDVEETLSASSPMSVLKSKDDSSKSGEDDDCFCCSKQMREDEDDDFDDAFDDWDGFSDALNSFENEDNKKGSPLRLESNTSGKKKKKKSDDEKQQDCPICFEEMDATDLSFVPCPCGFKLCLFCHKQINENDGLCPACRNKFVGQTHSNNSGQVSFQQRGRGTIHLSPSFQGLDRA